MPSRPILRSRKSPASMREAITQLDKNVARLNGRASKLTEAEWHRTVTAGADTADAAWIVGHAVHDATHHLRDVGRGLHALGAGAPTQHGVVAQVSTSAGGVPKRALGRITIGTRGVAGDVQAERKHHGKPMQALSLWSTDVIDALRTEGHSVYAGAAGENVTLTGIDWTTIRPGVRVQIGAACTEISGVRDAVCEERAVVLGSRLPSHRPQPASRMEPRVRVGAPRRRGRARRSGGRRALTSPPRGSISDAGPEALARDRIVLRRRVRDRFVDLCRRARVGYRRRRRRPARRTPTRPRHRSRPLTVAPGIPTTRSSRPSLVMSPVASVAPSHAPSSLFHEVIVAALVSSMHRSGYHVERAHLLLRRPAALPVSRSRGPAVAVVVEIARRQGVCRTGRRPRSRPASMACPA